MEIVQAVKNLNPNLASANELPETANFVHSFA